MIYSTNINMALEKKHSTIHPIIHLLNHIAENHDKSSKEKTLSIFLDLSKAFDTLPHATILHKLEHYGIRGIANMWFKSYLTDRKQFMTINSATSMEQPITCGVPQGSILGPILFILYVNDLHNASQLNILSFADDTTIYTSGKNINDMIQNTNIELRNIYKWFCANKLQLNANKSKYTIFCPRQTRLPIEMNNLIINNQKLTRIGSDCEEKSVKFLGVHLDDHLSWNIHVDYVHKKISQSLFAISRVKHIFPQSTLLSLYYALIHSHFNYAIQIWGNSNHLYKLITQQKRAIRAISNKPYLTHTEPLFKKTRILKLEDLYIQQTTSFMYELQNNLIPSFKNLKLRKEIKAMTTRQKNNVCTDRARTNFSSKLPKHNYPKIWNKCDINIRMAKSKTTLKKQIANIFINKYDDQTNCTNPNCRYCK